MYDIFSTILELLTSILFLVILNLKIIFIMQPVHFIIHRIIRPEYKYIVTSYAISATFDIVLFYKLIFSKGYGSVVNLTCVCELVNDLVNYL